MGTWMYSVMWLLSWQYCIYQMWPQHGSMQKYKKKANGTRARARLLTGLVWGSWHQLVKGHPLQYLIYIKSLSMAPGVSWQPTGNLFGISGVSMEFTWDSQNSSLYNSGLPPLLWCSLEIALFPPKCLVANAYVHIQVNTAGLSIEGGGLN